MNNPKNTIFGAKRLMGRKHDAPELASWAKLVPYGPLVQRMFFPDTDLVAKKFPDWSERWGREIAR